MEDVKKYLTVKEIAQRLDFTEEWVRDLIAKKEIKAIRIGRWRVKPEDLEDFIKSRMNIK
ncbi:helix-turn-helix domain-containing protein [Candidatus Gottesmanbacteria bacterium]|nr:helix-turn-helix domain-containing protein [Candidatus Gottesmanbacteria bacterium]